MNVGQLKKALESVPDDTPVVSDAEDHSYREIWGASATTGLLRGKHWTEDVFVGPLGEKTEYGVRMSVFKIGI